MLKLISDCQFYEWSSVTFQINESLGARNEKQFHEAGHVRVDEVHSLLEINCSVQIYKDVSNK